MIFYEVDADDVELLEDGNYQVQMWKEDVFREIDDFDLEEECNKRNLVVGSSDDEEKPEDYTREDLIRDYQSMNSEEFRRLLCCLTGNMFCVSDEKLLNDIKRRL